MASVHHSRWYGFGKMGVPDSLIHHSRGLFDRSPLRVRYELRLNIQGGLNARVA